MWSEWVVYVGACAVAPVQAYAIRTVAAGLLPSEPLIVSTILKPQGRYWGDVVGTNIGGEWLPPNGLVNVDDINAFLLFARASSASPPWTAVDLGGPEPNYVNAEINATDLQLILQGFASQPYPPSVFVDSGYPADMDLSQCMPDLQDEPDGDGGGQFTGGSFGGLDGTTLAGGSQAMAGGGPAQTVFSLSAQAPIISAGNLLEVEVYVDTATDLGAFEVAFDVSGGDAGSFEVEDVFIEQRCLGGDNDGLRCTSASDCPGSDLCLYRNDFVFGPGAMPITAADPGTPRIVAALQSGGMDFDDPRYVGTLALRASSDAAGIFQVSLRGEGATFLNDADAFTIPTNLGDPLAVGVDVKCAEDSHCDDASSCTADACQSGTCANSPKPSGTACEDDGSVCTTDSCDGQGTCVHTPQAAGTPCDDGLFCTLTDTCDAGGACVGQGSPCTGGTSYCCEGTQSCSSLPCFDW